MKILIYGAGVIGCLYAALLAESGDVSECGTPGELYAQTGTFRCPHRKKQVTAL